METIADFLELFDNAYFDPFSKFMRETHAYGAIFYVLLLLPLVVAFVYYIMLDHILLAKKKKWMIIGAATALISAGTAVFIAYKKVSAYIFAQAIQAPDIVIDNYITFGIIVFAYTAILYFIFSVIFKSFSSRCRNIPF